jgi:hypothetical protein
MHDPFPGRRVSRVEATEKAREKERERGELAYWRSVFCLLWQGGLLRGSAGSIALGLQDSHRLQALLFSHPSPFFLLFSVWSTNPFLNLSSVAAAL